MRVDLREELTGTVSEQTGRTAYRIVQEALTNARKHAPGAEVWVRLAGAPGQGLTVEVCNAACVAAPTPVARSGQGLVGLAERVALANGRLEHGPTAAGGLATVAAMTTQPWAVSVLIVDDDPLVRAGLRMMLGGASDIRVVAEAGDGTEVLPLVDRHAPDVVLMDIRMPAMDGLAATEALRARSRVPELPGFSSRTPRPMRSWPRYARWPRATQSCPRQ